LGALLAIIVLLHVAYFDVFCKGGIVSSNVMSNVKQDTTTITVVVSKEWSKDRANMGKQPKT
jgi:hypothetical protein